VGKKKSHHQTRPASYRLRYRAKKAWSSLQPLAKADVSKWIVCRRTDVNLIHRVFSNSQPFLLDIWMIRLKGFTRPSDDRKKRNVRPIGFEFRFRGRKITLRQSYRSSSVASALFPIMISIESAGSGKESQSRCFLKVFPVILSLKDPFVPTIFPPQYQTRLTTIKCLRMKFQTHFLELRFKSLSNDRYWGGSTMVLVRRYLLPALPQN